MAASVQLALDHGFKNFCRDIYNEKVQFIPLGFKGGDSGGMECRPSLWQWFGSEATQAYFDAQSAGRVGCEQWAFVKDYMLTLQTRFEKMDYLWLRICDRITVRSGDDSYQLITRLHDIYEQQLMKDFMEQPFGEIRAVPKHEQAAAQAAANPTDALSKHLYAVAELIVWEVFNCDL